MGHFKLETEISGFMCSFEKGQELEFHYKSPSDTVVSLKQRDRWEEEPSRGNAICTAITIKDVGPVVQAEIMDCIEGNHVKIGKVKPETLKLVDPLFVSLRAISRSTIVMFNWTHGLDSPPDPCPSVRSYASYSEDGEHWFHYSEVRNVSFDVASLGIFARNAQIDEVVRRVEAGVEEPLSRQLFREAWSQVGTNPRSALVIGVAAAEVGVKKLIATLVPGTDWLMQEIETPPIGKILRKFLPTLRVKAKWVDGGPITTPRQLIRLVEKAVEHRNKVVHTGAPPPSREELVKMLRAISDLLWLCDVYLGELWAMKHVSLETKKNWQGKGG